MSKKNGIIPDVYENTNNLQDILANNDVNFKERGACADNILSGVLEETLLSKYFFSTENILNLQKMMRYYYFLEIHHLFTPKLILKKIIL